MYFCVDRNPRLERLKCGPISGILGPAETSAAAMLQTASQILPGMTDAAAAKVGAFDGQPAMEPVMPISYPIGGDAIGTTRVSCSRWPGEWQPQGQLGW